MKSIANITLSLLLSSSLWAAPTAQEIVNKANQAAYFQGDDGKSTVKMEIKDSQNRVRNREFIILRKNVNVDKGEQNYYVYFKKPADVNKMGFLVWKYESKDDDRWLYLPALDLVKRIAATDKRTSFVGSNFFYEDVSGRGTNEDTHKLVSTDKTFFVIESTPKDKTSVEFTKYKMWIHKQSYIPTKIDYFDKKGEVYRTYQALGVKKIQGIWTVTKASMKDHKTKGETTNTMTKVQYNIGLPEEIFSERYLRKAPRKYLR